MPRALGATLVHMALPGVTLARCDEGYVAPAVSDPFLRRRRTT